MHRGVGQFLRYLNAKQIVLSQERTGTGEYQRVICNSPRKPELFTLQKRNRENVPIRGLSFVRFVTFLLCPSNFRTVRRKRIEKSLASERKIRNRGARAPRHRLKMAGARERTDRAMVTGVVEYRTRQIRKNGRGLAKRANASR